MNRIHPVKKICLIAILVLYIGCADNESGPTAPNGNGGHEHGLWYVDAAASGAGDGSSWRAAFTHPQEAMNAASSGNTIWVARGTYLSPEPDNPAVPVLAMKDSVAIYGCFSPGDNSYEDRDCNANPTTLDGNGTAYHVVVAADDVRISGFIIARGNADGDEPDNVGAGILNINTSMRIDRCSFEDNVCSWHGAGIFNQNSSSHITECTFSGNRAANNGGAMYNDNQHSPNARPAISGCHFTGNRDSRFGGAVFNFYYIALFTHCTFQGNYANHNGGGMYNYHSNAKIYSCTFENNTSVAGAGIFINASDGSSPHVKNCLFFENEASTSGGGLYITGGMPAVYNCTFSGNSARYGGAVSSWNSGGPIFNCIMWDNSALFYDPEIQIGDGIEAVVIFSDIDQEGYGLVPGGGTDANNNIRLDPLFTAGPFGIHYLSHRAAGQGGNSPCIDAGGSPAAQVFLDIKTTRSDNEPDEGIVDMGYHYNPE